MTHSSAGVTSTCTIPALKYTEILLFCPKLDLVKFKKVMIICQKICLVAFLVQLGASWSNVQQEYVQQIQSKIFDNLFIDRELPISFIKCAFYVCQVSLLITFTFNGIAWVTMGRYYIEMLTTLYVLRDKYCLISPAPLVST